MISDAYTREYDEREKNRRFVESLQRVGKTAERLGLSLSVLETAKRLTLRIHFSNGSKFLEFRKLENALAWAEKWK